MANLGNLIVRGVTRILGDAYANKFIGNLQGNADTATSAIKASTADSATSATSANKASIATAVQDYGTSDYREIKIGYLGSGLSSSDITHAVGFTDSGTKLKDISKDEFRKWLTTDSGTWPITVSNSSNSANAEYANYLNVNYGNEFRFGNISSDQTVLWFNYANPDGTQNNVSAYYFGDGKNGTNSKIIAAQFTGNAASASTIAVGQGTADVYRSVYFADNSNISSVVVDSKLKYNPSSGDLKVTKINSGNPITSLNIGFNNGYIPKYVEFPVSETLVSLGYNTQDHIHDDDYYFLGLLKWAYNEYKNNGDVLLIGNAIPNSIGNCQIQLYSSYPANSDGIPQYASGLYESLYGTIYTFNSVEYNYRFGQINANNAATATNADLLDGYHASNLVKFYLSPMESGAPASSAKSWFENTMPSGAGAIVYNVPGSEKTIIVGKSTGAYGHMLQLNYDDKYLRILRYCAGNWRSDDWEKISAGYADSAGDADKLDGYHANDFATAGHTHYIGDKPASDLSSTYPQGISVGGIYANGYPFQFGSTITAYGSGGYFQIAGQWNSDVTGDSNYDFPTEMYIRGRRDSYDVWTTWTRVLTDRNYTNVLDNRYIQSEIDPIWTADKVNYYTKTECNNKFQLKGAYLTEQNLQGYATTTWVNSNYYTCSESDSRYIQSETDPVWTADKGNYYTKTECDNRFQPKGTYLTEQNLQGYATQEWVRGEEYLYRSGGTMDARAEIGITTKLFIGNSTSPDTCYTKFNCVLHGGGDESNPNWIIRDNGYSEFKSSVSANAFYASSDIRLKNILDDINIDFDKLKLIPKKYYTWKGSDILQLGTIAQDIQKIYPEVVSKNENGYLSVDYSKLSIIALAAIDKLNERIKELECQIKL